jgi:type IV pilus assembly protein PilB
MDKTILDYNKSIEDILFEKKLINQDQLSAIKFEQVNTGKSIDQIIKERAYVSERDFIQAYGESYGVPFIDLSEIKIPQDLFEYVNPNQARAHRVVPFKLEEKTLFLAMADPLDLQIIEFLERKTGFKVKSYIALDSQIDHALGETQGKAIGEEISAALQEIEQTALKLDGNQGAIDDDATVRAAPIAKIVGMILETAVKTGASDIHIEPSELVTRLRYRIDGVLSEKRTFPREMHDPLVARIKILGRMKIDEKRIPQDGRFPVMVGDTKTDLRVSTLPTIYGEKVVIRLLKDSAFVYTFRDLGMRGLTLRRFEEAILNPVGMILVTGPTGSGKTVTLATSLSKLNTSKVNIITIEDPVEIRVKGVNQVQINPKAGLTFAVGLRAFLRQDPDIVMVGEIRDGETAELAIHGALTGHLVLSTLHTNSAAGAIPRLIDMGIENFLIASTVNAILAQRLPRKICEHCREEYEPPQTIVDEILHELSPLKESDILMHKDKDIAEQIKKITSPNYKMKLFRGKGCEKCGNEGFKGRFGIYECLKMSDEIGQLTLKSSPESEIDKVSREQGMLTLLQDGYLRVLEGKTTIEEIMRVARG